MATDTLCIFFVSQKQGLEKSKVAKLLQWHLLTVTLITYFMRWSFSWRAHYKKRLASFPFWGRENCKPFFYSEGWSLSTRPSPGGRGGWRGGGLLTTSRNRQASLKTPLKGPGNEKVFPLFFFTVYRTALQRKKHLCILFLGIVRPHSQFPHSCVCERFIYSQDRSTYFLQIHCGNI